MTFKYDAAAQLSAFEAAKERGRGLGVPSGFSGRGLVLQSVAAVETLRRWQLLVKQESMSALRGYHDTSLPYMMRERLGMSHTLSHDPPVAARFLAWHLQWAMYGLPVFNLTHSLAAGLALTEPASGADDELRLPFPSFLIRMPVPDGPLTFSALDGSVDTVTHIAVSTVRWPTGPHFVHTNPLYGIRREDIEAIKLEQHVSTFAIGASGVELNGWAPVPERGGIREWVDIEDKKMPDLTSRDYVAMASIRSFIANLCSYLNEHPARKTWDGTRSAGRRTSTRPSVFSVGNEVELPSQMHAAARAYAARDRDAGEWTRMTRFVVRGHMHSFWYGSKTGGERVLKPKWVQPYWKGPEMGIPAPRTYAVDELPPDDQ